MNFKVGDKVKLKDGLEEGKEYGGVTLLKDMQFYGVTEIAGVTGNEYYDIDANSFRYAPEMLEPYPEELTAEEAWETARRLCSNQRDGGLSWWELVEIFGTPYFDELFEQNTVYEAAEKIRKWEKNKVIQYGDVVKYDGKRYIVGKVAGDYIRVFSSDMSVLATKESLIKLGHIDLDKLMEDIDAD